MDSTHFRTFASQIINSGHFYGAALAADRFGNRLEIMGLITALEAKTKCVTYTIDDGSSSLLCIRWVNSEKAQNCGLFEPELACGQTVIVRGRLSASDGHSRIAVDEILPVENISQEIYWINQTLFLNTQIYPKFDKTVHLKNVPTAISIICPIWSKIEAALGLTFDEFEIEQALIQLKMEKTPQKLLESWVEQGIIFRSPMKQYKRTTDEELSTSLLRILRKPSGAVHHRFVWNCLRTDGFLISKSCVLDALEQMTDSSKCKISREAGGLFLLHR